MDRLLAAIKERRLRLGLSQHDIERRTGLSQSRVSKFERGVADPTVGELRLYLRALNCERRMIEAMIKVLGE
jgi:transcriptional regulator with XRE-family HTH domain